MKVKVVLFLNGKLIEEVVEAVDYDDARRTALRRNSDQASVVSTTAVF